MWQTLIIIAIVSWAAYYVFKTLISPWLGDKQRSTCAHCEIQKARVKFAGKKKVNHDPIKIKTNAKAILPDYKLH